MRRWLSKDELWVVEQRVGKERWRAVKRASWRGRGVARDPVLSAAAGQLARRARASAVVMMLIPVYHLVAWTWSPPSAAPQVALDAGRAFSVMVLLLGLWLIVVTSRAVRVHTANGSDHALRRVAIEGGPGRSDRTEIRTQDEGAT